MILQTMNKNYIQLKSEDLRLYGNRKGSNLDTNVLKLISSSF